MPHSATPKLAKKGKVCPQIWLKIKLELHNYSQKSCEFQDFGDTHNNYFTFECILMGHTNEVYWSDL